MSAALRLVAAVALGAALASCAKQVDAPLSPTFGQAVASMDNQVIDPTPAQGLPESSAAKGAAAIVRYEQDRVKEPPGGASGGGGGESSGDTGAKSGGSGEQKQ